MVKPDLAEVAAARTLSRHAIHALLSAPSGAKGTQLTDLEPAVVRELRDGLINSKHQLTGLGAVKHTQLTEETNR